MNTSPVRHPAFCLLCIAALSGAVAARQHNPVKTLVIERIESRYVADRTQCDPLDGAARRECRSSAELRYDVALSELDRLRNEPATSGSDDAPKSQPAASVALGAGQSPS